MFDHHTAAILKDHSHDENGVGEGRKRVYFHSQGFLPIGCKACRVMFESYIAFVSHCKI